MTNAILDKLRSHIQESSWLGKTIFAVGDFYTDFRDHFGHFIANLPGISQLLAFTDPVFKPLQQIAKGFNTYFDACSSAWLHLFETAYGANRAYKSKLYPNGADLRNAAQMTADKIQVGRKEMQFYKRTVKLYNKELRMFEVQNRLSGFVPNSNVLIEPLVQEALPLVEVAEPAIMDTILGVRSLAAPLLQISGLEASKIPLATDVVTSIVCKNFGSSGAHVMRYTIAELIKDGGAAVAVEAPRGATVWATVVAIAPWVIFASVVLIMAFMLLRNKETTIGSDLYCFAEAFDRSHGFGHYHYFEKRKMTKVRFNSEIRALYKELTNLPNADGTSVRYSGIYGLLKERDEWVQGVVISDGFREMNPGERNAVGERMLKTRRLKGPDVPIPWIDEFDPNYNP